MNLFLFTRKGSELPGCSGSQEAALREDFFEVVFARLVLHYLRLPQKPLSKVFDCAGLRTQAGTFGCPTSVRQPGLWPPRCSDFAWLATKQTLIQIEHDAYSDRS